MQVISAYLVKQIVDLVVPETTIRYTLVGERGESNELTVTITQYIAIGESETSEVLAVLTHENENNDDWWSNEYIRLFTKYSSYGALDWGCILEKANVQGNPAGTRLSVAGAVSIPSSTYSRQLTFET